MNSTLIALYSNTWNSFWDNSELEGERNPEILKAEFNLISRFWDESSKLNPNSEYAFFTPSLTSQNDYYPAHFRRFKQVGATLADKIRNLFELGFEKGFNRVVFVEPILIFHSTDIIQNLLESWPDEKMIFLPETDGKVALCGMEEKHFWNWNNFNFDEKESIVELLSDCNSKGINFQLLDSCDPEKMNYTMQHHLKLGQKI